jgi:putative drug exporter of the RND superfamily
MSSTRDNSPRPSGILARLARWSMGHRAVVALGWVALLIGVGVISRGVGTNYASNFTLSGTDSQRATDLLKQDFPTQAGDEDQIVLRAKQGTVTDPATRSRVAPVLAQVAHLPHVSDVVSPYSPAGAGQVSRDGRIAFAGVSFDQRANDLPKSAVNKVISVAKGAGSSQLQVELGGQAIEQTQQASLGFVTAIGLLAAMVVLLITFGSVVAMGLPIVTALLGLGTGVGLIAIGTHVINMPDFSTELAVMIGLGVGIDYSLFIVTRFRENYRNGHDLQGAIVAAMDTAGRAVLFAGCTVILALLGMFALGVSFLYGLAIAASLGVLMTMLAALTVLPVLLSRFGEPPPIEAGSRVDSGLAGRGSSSGIPGRGRSSGSRSCSRSQRPCSDCGWARATRATTPPAPQRARPTTCWPLASARASTARYRWS